MTIKLVVWDDGEGEGREFQLSERASAALRDAVNSEREIAEDSLEDFEGEEQEDQECYVNDLYMIEDFITGDNNGDEY